MKILQLCSRVPYPPNDGGSIAMLALSQSLKAEGNEIFILSINTNKHHYDLKNLPNEMLALAKWDAVDVNTDVKPLDAFLNLFTDKSYNIIRFHSRDFENKLVELLQKEQFDIIQMESLYVTTYCDLIRKYSKAKIVYRAHNVEYLIWERMAMGMQSGLKKRYIKLLANRLKNYEISVLKKFDAIVFITPEDKELYHQLGNASKEFVAPIGINPKEFELQENSNHYPVLFHLGSMNWLPNIKAIDWFIDNVWKKLHDKYPALKFYIAGRGMPERLLKRTVFGLYVDNEIPDAKVWMNEKDIMIVPLLSGSGMRVKIIEGMALGKTVIATSIGAEGIVYTHKENILIANSPDEFVSMVELCINDKKMCKNIGRNAKELVQEKYNNKEIGVGLHSFYQSLIKD